MKLSETFKQVLCYLFLLGVLSFMLLSCSMPQMSKRHKTEDEKQLEFFKQQIKIRTHYLTKI